MCAECLNLSKNADHLTLGITLLMTRFFMPAIAFSIPAGPGQPLDVKQREWNDYTANHVGKWRGMWTTYDAAGNQQGDSDRVDTTIELSPDGKTLRHTKTLYVGSIESECSNCFDSVETREILVGVFTKDTFRQRSSGPIYLNGPGVTRRGSMNIELGIRNGNRRRRCIVTHRPQFDGVATPSQLVLDRIVVVNEISSDHNFDSEEALGSLRSQIGKSRWLGLWQGRNLILDAGDNIASGHRNIDLKWRDEIWPPSQLNKCQCSGDDGDGSHALLELDCGVRLETPRVVRGGEPTEMSVTWAVDRVTPNEPSRVAHAKVRFEALSKIIDEGEDIDASYVCISTPKLLRFDVADLEHARLES